NISGFTFADAANQMMSLDCVVSTDATIAHLAGSLGLPTLFIVTRAESRWGLEDTTPWYPTMRLIHRRRPGDWSTIISELDRAVTALVSARRSDATGEKLELRVQ